MAMVRNCCFGTQESQFRTIQKRRFLARMRYILWFFAIGSVSTCPFLFSRFYLPVSISFPWISVSCFPALAPAQRKRPAGHQRPAGLLEKMRNAQKEKSRGLSACSSIWILIIKGTGIILLRQPVCLCIYRSSGILCERV